MVHFRPTETSVLPITLEISAIPTPSATSIRSCRFCSIDQSLPLKRKLSAGKYRRTVLKIINTNAATKSNGQTQKCLLREGRRLELFHCFCPHSGQKCADESILVLHLGQIFRTAGCRRFVPQKLQ